MRKKSNEKGTGAEEQPLLGLDGELRRLLSGAVYWRSHLVAEGVDERR
jgi:hypothetical protein